MVKVLQIRNAAAGNRRPLPAALAGFLGAAALILLWPGAGQAQTGKAAGAASEAAQSSQPADPPPTTTNLQPTASAGEQVQALTAVGHRDPFRPVIVLKASANQMPTHLPPGKPGLVIGQLSLLGIVRGLNGVWIGVVDNRSKRAYFLYQDDQLYDGTVSKITPNSIVFQERFTDPTGQQKTREIVKELNAH